ncbi:holo-ACP synthase [Paenibacillus wynnii]|uniref:Holo-[acyl-carrier-protein] synthase n=1 Tax=Paenibacillus wynnii TaxID=268407 RepID=A0A098MBQ1_9BACL|nr:holo-ACP synthase [Paenibacillus wynnii]KGE19483.1 4'-phosphopantetheinyl transferase [Paenibacillus wynnii]
MIYGIGHDVLDIDRISALMEGRLRDKFIERVLTAREIELSHCRGRKLPEYVAGRFSAKEAIVKALGCGIGSILGFTDIEIVPDGLGKPEVRLSAEAWSRLGLPKGHNYKIHLTITHERRLASAFAVVEQQSQL